MTIIDIGGQDTKIICVEQGFVKDFMMNDKCSAGTRKILGNYGKYIVHASK